MVFGELQQRFRHAYMVIEIALRVEHTVFLFQHGRDEFLCGGLAVGARHTYYGGAEGGAVQVRQLLECGESIIHEDDTLVALFCIFHFVDDGICGSLLQCALGICVAVESVAFEGEEQ